MRHFCPKGEKGSESVPVMRLQDFENVLRGLGIKLPTGPSKSEAAQQLMACTQQMWRLITQSKDGDYCDLFVPADCVVASMMQDSNQIVDHLRFTMATDGSDEMIEVSISQLKS